MEIKDSSTRYKKVVGGYKDIESDIYSNYSPNDDLKNKFIHVCVSFKPHSCKTFKHHLTQNDSCDW
jgi:hypothetical protein